MRGKRGPTELRLWTANTMQRQLTRASTKPIMWKRPINSRGWQPWMHASKAMVKPRWSQNANLYRCNQITLRTSWRKTASIAAHNPLMLPNNQNRKCESHCCNEALRWIQEINSISGAGGASASPKFWFVKNLGKFSKKLGTEFPKFSTLMKLYFVMLSKTH